MAGETSVECVTAADLRGETFRVRSLKEATQVKSRNYNASIGRAPLVFETRTRTELFLTKVTSLASRNSARSGHRRAHERTRAPDPYKTIFQWLRA
jgi:hypothetical protein